MKHLLIALTLLLAGCAAPEETTPVDAGGNETAAPEVLPASDFQFSVEFAEETQQETVAFNITVSEPIQLTVLRDFDVVFSQETDGGTYTLPLEYGTNLFSFNADNGKETLTQAINVTRLAESTFEVQYGGYPGQTNHVHTFWYNPSGAQSGPAYEGRDTSHPGYATIHDFMVEWENQYGEAIEYAYSDGLGFSVSKINGAGSPLTSSTPPYWLYDINGESPDLGISAQAMQAGDHVRWCLNACS